MELTLDWPGLGKPRVMECVEWLQGDAGDEDAVESGWRQPLGRMSQITFVSHMVSAFVSPRNFIWWNPDSHGYGIHRRSFCEAMELWGWSLLSELSAFICKRHTDLPSPPFVWGYRKKCVTRKDPAWPRCGNPFPLFLSLWFSFVIATQKDRDSGLTILRQFSKPCAIYTKVQSIYLVWCNTVIAGWQFVAGFHNESREFRLLGSMTRMMNNCLILWF